MERGRGILPHQSPPLASGQLFAVPCKTHPHWRSRGLGGRFERLFYLRSVLTELTLPVRRDLEALDTCESFATE